MYKNLILLFTALIISQISFTQTAIAKLKFEDAEEAFNNKDYLTALAKLDEAEEIFGKTGPPILYLRIMCLDKIVEAENGKDPENIHELKNNCAFYLSIYEEASVEDKYRDVYKISAKIEKYDQGEILYIDALEGKAGASLKLGTIYYRNKNYKQAMDWYMKAATNEEDVEAMDAISDMYRDGIGVGRDFLKSLEWDRKAAALGYAVSMNDIGDMYYVGRGVSKDYTMSMEWYQKAANKGDSDAMYRIGDIYEKGYGVPQDRGKAIKWYIKAANEGSIYAMNSAGIYYYNGISVAKDKTVAFGWFKKAAEGGSAEAMSNIGAAYENGEGVLKNDEEAFKWYKKAAEKGQNDAMLSIARFYGEGLANLSKDARLEAEWYKNAAENGNANAMYVLGSCYDVAYGGIPFNQIEGFKWYLKAAENGYIDAMKEVSKRYKTGTGITKNKDLAREWQAKYDAAKSKK